MAGSAFKSCILLAATSALLAFHSTNSAAQEANAPNKPDPADANSQAAFEVNQIKLTHDHVKNFIAAQSDLASIAPKIQDAGAKPDTSIQKELEDIATRHGFKNFAELDDVAANISIVMAGLDSQSGEFVDPVETLKIELADVKADNTIPAGDKKQLVDELTEAIKTTPALKFKQNVEIVKEHREDLEKALE